MSFVDHRPATRGLASLAFAAALAGCAGPQAGGPPSQRPDFARQAACSSLLPASQGGPMPEGDTAVLRWLGTSNYELAYRNTVILMDTFYDRPARTRPLGFDVKDVKRADAILIGHAHFDHITDVAPVAAATRAPVVGSAITATTAQKLGVPAAQTVTVRGGETLRYGDVTVRPTHILHSTIQPELIPALANLYRADGLGPLTEAEERQSKASSARGSWDPKIVTEGTMGFTLELPGGFNITWFDSVGDIHPDERRLAAELAGRMDVALFPWTPHPIAERQLAYTFQHLELFKPKLYVPTHHDHIWGVWLDNGLEPLFMKIRDELPGTRYASPLYRSPICLSTSGPTRGEFHVGR
jgi:L-ascorbate metabolism protein UlaG (beta-lactamase superfamily)